MNDYLNFRNKGCPCNRAWLWHGIATAKAFAEAGASVVLGTSMKLRLARR